MTKKEKLNSIGASAFIELMNRESLIADYKVEGNVFLASGNFPIRRSTTIKNCEFTGFVLNADTIFVEFNNCIAESIAVDVSAISTFRLLDSKVDKVILKIAEGSESNPLIRFSGDSTSVKKLEMSGKFKDVGFEEGFIGELDCDITCWKLEFQPSHAKLVSFTGAYDILLLNSADTSYVLTNTKCKTILIKEPVGSSFDFNEIDVNKLSLLGASRTTLEFRSCTIKRGMLSQGNYEKIGFYGISECDIQLMNPILNKRTKINEFLLVSFQLSSGSRLNFSNLSVNRLTLNKFESNGELTFNDLQVIQELAIDKSNLGVTSFSDVSGNCRIFLANSEISNVTFTNFRWSEDFKIVGSDLLSERESYRLLKTNYSKNGNRIEALEFQRHELKAHYSILLNEVKVKWKSTKWGNPNKWPWKSTGNYLIIGSNKAFSDFGQNIWKPLIFLFGFHFVLYNILLILTPNLGISYGWPIDGETTYRAIGLYFQTLLPVHSNDVRHNGALIPIGGFWDFMIRLSSGYFIYYFISATRKYHQ